VREVSDVDDPQLADFRALNDAELRARYEGNHGVCIVEGPLAVRQLLTSSYAVRSLLVTPQQRDALIDVLRPVEHLVHVAPPEVLRAVVGFDLHRGAVACAVRPRPAVVDDVLAGARTVVVLERVNDHENLGGIFRNARALGADAVLLDDETADPLYRRSIRVSMGHVLHVPFARVGPLPNWLEALRASGFSTVALTPDQHAQSLHEFAASRPERLALLLGAEGPGLRDETMAAADVRVRIPVSAEVDSLNVATAAAIALYALS
jgi:tRNA G18 (ribose-2'-O)-methylase SpoU